MSVWRESGDDCPIPAAQAEADHEPTFDRTFADIDLCGPCPYFRGASMPPVERDQNGVIADHRPIHLRWRMNCNFPRDGMYRWEPDIVREQASGPWVDRPAWLDAAFGQ